MKFKDYILESGYKRFKGCVNKQVYEYFQCPHPEKGKWYYSPELKSFQCIGCAWQCETDDPSGFQLFLPLEPSQKAK